jgi:aspartyl-tRNA(Asn)/glutamyl-tRNA(Gln) amidotransferase subunit C
LSYIAAMSAPIDKAQVLHVAKLARLTLLETEVPAVTEQLVKILGHIAHLQEVNTDGVEPTAQVGVDRMPLREDAVRPGLDRPVVMSQAPETAAGGFVVPAFVEE